MKLQVDQAMTDEGTRRLLLLSDIKNQPSDRIDIFFDMLQEQNVPQPTVLDGYVLGIIFYAMGLGQDIQVEGALTREALRNLDDFQDAWTLWRPDKYKKVSISCTSLIDHVDAYGRESAIAAFSGGADSIFTVLRHSHSSMGDASYPLTDSVLLVHGFDVKLNEPTHLEALKDRVFPFIDSRSLKISVIRTNLKELNLQNWEDSFMSQLACCLHNYAHKSRFGLVGSSEPYNSLVLPWGSNPATDHLLSGGGFKLVHDGAGFSRTAKVREIAKNPLATKILKVCWEGEESFRNCGYCEKCLRTKLNFLAVGVNTPSCFETPLEIKQISEIRLANTAQVAELSSILVYARAHGQNGSWADELARRIKHGVNRPTLLQLLRQRLIKAVSLILKGDWATLTNMVKDRITGHR